MEGYEERRIRNSLKSRISGIAVEHDFVSSEWINKLEKTKGVCNCCGKYVGIGNLTIDHILPISYAPKGFKYKIEDVRPLCSPCNISKYNNGEIDDVLIKYGLIKGKYETCDLPNLKTIKIDDEVHEMIARAGKFGESFSDVIRRVFEKAKK